MSFLQKHTTSDEHTRERAWAMSAVRKIQRIVKKGEKEHAEAEADLVIVGHTHFPLERWVDGVHVLNLGSVSNPITPRLQASYALLEADTNGYQLQPHFVDYNRQAVIEAIQQISHPAASFLMQFMRGEKISPWV